MTRSPNLRQLLGLGVTLASVVLFSWLALRAIGNLRSLQTESIERNRRNSQQLARVQNDLQQLGLILRDMLQTDERYPLAAYKPQLERLRTDLEDALTAEAKVAPPNRGAQQQQLLRNTSDRIWAALDETWNLAAASRENEARSVVRTRVEAERQTLTANIARLLAENDASTATAARSIEETYGSVERNIYWLLAAVLAAISLTSFLVIRFNRRAFQQIENLSEKRKELAGQIISVQEETFRTLARELHDEFGQVLTAMGMMLSRAERLIQPADSPVKGDLREVREIANVTLERVRTMTQMLHPPVLDDYGLEKSIEWYIGQFGKQTGLSIQYEKVGISPWIGDQTAIHVYRILQEALTNVVKHSGRKEVRVVARYNPESLMLDIEDKGVGIRIGSTKGIGLIAMRERAELLGGTIEFGQPEGGGTRVRVHVPLTKTAGQHERTNSSTVSGRS